MDIVQLGMFDGKVCVRCKQEKSDDAFARDKNRRDGLYPHCKECTKKAREKNKGKWSSRSADYQMAAKARFKQRQKEKACAGEGRNCSTCGVWKPLTDYYGYGVHGITCKQCANERVRKDRTENPGKYQEYRHRKWRKNTDHSRRLSRESYWRRHDSIRARQRAAYQNNAEKVKSDVQRYRKQYPDRVRETNKRTWQRHGHVYKENAREYRAQNREMFLEKARQRYAESPDKAKEQARRWRQEHPEKRRVYGHLRRARKMAVGGSYTESEWQALCTWFGNQCLSCGEIENLTVDHVVPLIKGGRNSIDNLQPLCFSCNCKKQAKTIDYRDPDILAAFLESLHAIEHLSSNGPSDK